jgi:hypothetical protein
MLLRCPECGADFTPRNSRQVCCSRVCGNRQAMRRLTAAGYFAARSRDRLTDSSCREKHAAGMREYRRRRAARLEQQT